jgi:hypothetical protein
VAPAPPRGRARPAQPGPRRILDAARRPPGAEPGWLYCALTCTPVGDDRWWVSLRHYDLDGLRHYERSPEQVSGRAVSDRRRQLAAQGWDEILCTQDGARLLCAYRRGA